MSPRPFARGPRPLLGLVLAAGLLLAGLTAIRPTSVAAAPPTAPATIATSLVLDNVTLHVRTHFLPAPAFRTTGPEIRPQVAIADAPDPFREFTITSVPFGMRPGTEALPAAEAGGAAVYRAALRAFRDLQDAAPQDGPTALLFGQRVPGMVSHVALHVDGSALTPLTIAEWVVDAGPRLWIVRISFASAPGEAAADPAALVVLQDLTMTADDVTAPPVAAPDAPGPPRAAAPAGPADVPMPPWWQGYDCDAAHYRSGSGGIEAYRLGAAWQGLIACGPRPIYDGGPDVLVRFYAGAWGEYEWECVELAMRWLYQAYGVAPYQANGSQVVWNYPGTLLRQIGNGTAYAAPQPGDVVSYGATTSYGHASVVTSASVDAQGNGTLTVIEEDSSATGSNTLTVHSWWVSGSTTSVSGWLHAGGGAATPVPTVPPRPASPTPVPTAPPGPTATPPPPATATAPEPSATVAVTPPPCPLPFTDVDPTTYFYWPVAELYCHGIISGYADGTFRPYNSTTRAQLIKIVALAVAIPAYTPPDGGSTYTDVPPGSPFFGWIEAASHAGLIGGYPCGGPDEPCDPAFRNYFRPYTSVTRGQVAKIVVLSAGWPLNPPPNYTFTDVPPDSPFAPYVEAAAAHNLISGYFCGGADEPCDAQYRPYFRPYTDVVRGQLAKILYLAGAGAR